MSEKAEKEAAKVAKQAEKEAATNNIIVEDPLVLRPKALPLVVKPENGSWANDAQAEFAQVLNGYAYKNTAKWEKKKNDQVIGGKVVKGLLTQLAELATNPEKIFILKGEPEFQEDGSGQVKFKNQLLGK